MAPRRANGERTRPRKRADGRWTIQIRYTDPATGLSRRVQMYGRTISDVVEESRGYKNAIARGQSTKRIA
jgi:hypothetical protein